MARTAKLWFWEARGIYCVYVRGKKHLLGSDKTEATRLFHELMGRPENKPVEIDANSVAKVLDDFYESAKQTVAPRTASRYWDFLQEFIKHSGRVPVADLTAAHVTAWLETKKSWNSTTKFNAVTAVQRALNWSVKNNGLKFNPIRGMEKPKQKARSATVQPEEFEAILKLVKDQRFRDLLILTYDCGARPFEIKRLEARHIEMDKHRAVLPTGEAKKNIPRAIYFPTPRSVAMIKRLMKIHPTGPLLLNRDGAPWDGHSVKCRFARLEKKIGRRVRHYDLRRTFITDKIKAGVDSHVVAKIVGHQSTAMIDKHYSVIGEDAEFMLAQAKKKRRS